MVRRRSLYHIVYGSFFGSPLLPGARPALSRGKTAESSLADETDLGMPASMPGCAVNPPPQPLQMLCSPIVLSSDSEDLVMDSRSSSTTQRCILPAAKHLLRLRSSRSAEYGRRMVTAHRCFPPKGRCRADAKKAGGRSLDGCKGVLPAAKHRGVRLNSSGKVGKKQKKDHNVQILAGPSGSKSASAQDVGGASSRGSRPQVRTYVRVGNNFLERQP